MDRDRAVLFYLLLSICIFVLSLSGCEEENRYSRFDCFQSPLEENFSLVGIPLMYESVQMSLLENLPSSTESIHLSLEIENTSEVHIWFPPQLNLIMWIETSENDFRSFGNLLSSEIDKSLSLGPSGSNNSKLVIPIAFDISDNDLPANMAITLWGYRQVDNTYCEDHHGGIVRFVLDTDRSVTSLDDN